jgi:hypothetical protein
MAFARTSLMVALAGLAALAGCTQGNGLPAQSPGYLANDTCSAHRDQTSCSADARGCDWIIPEIALGAPTRCGGGWDDGDAPNTEATPLPLGPSCDPITPQGVCVVRDPCLALDEAACHADSGCAWSAVKTLCPVGSDCTSGGFCHAKDSGGGDCACVSPVVCPVDGPCAQVECDCSGGGGGGACTCNCLPCAPGESCPPCACDCNDGGSNCTDPGTCACACPACAPGETCPPCECKCEGGGGTSIGPAPVPPPDAPEARPECVCDCAGCPDGSTDCPPCQCDCPVDDGGSWGGGSTGGTMSGCIPPPPPPSRPGPAPTDPDDAPKACPAIGCLLDCFEGYAKDQNGCPICECADPPPTR